MFGWMKRDKADAKTLWLALAAYIVMLIINGLAGSTTILGGVNTAEVSDSFPNLFAPAGHTFAIWGVIYLATGLFLLRAFGVIKRGKKLPKPAKLNEVVRLFMITSVVNTAWLFAWQYKVMWLSVILIITLLVVLRRINVGLRDEKIDRGEHLLVRAPFSIYFGWLTVATIANITAWLVSVNWDGFGLSDGTWMVAALLVGAVIGVKNALMQRDWLYMAVFVWAYAGILTKHLAESGFDGKYPSTLAALYILLPVLIATSLAIAMRWPYGKNSQPLL